MHHSERFIEQEIGPSYGDSSLSLYTDLDFAPYAPPQEANDLNLPPLTIEFDNAVNMSSSVHQAENTELFAISSESTAYDAGGDPFAIPGRTPLEQESVPAQQWSDQGDPFALPDSSKQSFDTEESCNCDCDCDCDCNDREQQSEEQEFIIHSVSSGENLWRIAERYYGDGMMYHKIVEANRDLIKDPDLIYPDWQLKIPIEAVPTSPPASPASPAPPQVPVIDDSVPDDEMAFDESNSTFEPPSYEEGTSDQLLYQEDEVNETDSPDLIDIDSSEFFFTQFEHPTWNPHGKTSSSDCGPASLAMAIRYYGTYPDGFDPSWTDETLIDETRFAMTRSLVNVNTNMTQLRVGATKAGLANSDVHSIDEIDEAISAGHMVIAAGNPTHYLDDFGFTGDDYARDLSPEKDGEQRKDDLYRKNHIVLVAGKTSNGNYIVNDPACKRGPLILTKLQLEQYWNGAGLAVWPAK